MMNNTSKMVLIIATTAFEIDHSSRELRQWDNPANSIAFDDLKDEGECFTLEYNIKTGNINRELYEVYNRPASIINVLIPAEILQASDLDTDECRELNEASITNKWQFFIGNSFLARRLAGVLPHIDLAGNDFTIDWRLKELRETAAPHNRINLKNMEMSDEGTEYYCLFHTKNHTEYFPAADIREMPAHLVFLKIPYELMLDPVGVAREYGLPDTYLLNNFPIQEHLSAKVLPLSETNIAAIIKSKE